MQKPFLPDTPEARRIWKNSRYAQYWSLWGPYLSERQWGTVREDYSANGDAWNAFSFEDAMSRAYRWGEDGLLGWCDRHGRLCFAPTLWNERDPILKERLFGVSGPQGNHGEDVKELYYYLDATPTYSYAKALYKYPQAAFPYAQLLHENATRSRKETEFELWDTGIFNENRYFDVFVEYAKADISDVAVRLTIWNRGEEDAPLHLLPTLWYRNTWAWGDIQEECLEKPEIRLSNHARLIASHATLGRYILECGKDPEGKSPSFLFTENETNTEKLFGTPNATPYVKDAFHEAVIHSRFQKVHSAQVGTKASPWYRFNVPAGKSVEIRLRLYAEESRPQDALGKSFEDLFSQRIKEADAFYAERIEGKVTGEERRIARQAYAGLMWSTQFYNLVQTEWLEGDPAQPPPPEDRPQRNADWQNLFSRDILTVPDKWEYPYFCTWDSAFHMVSLCHVDPFNAKRQLLLLLREWYMHPNGQLPAYEWNFCDVNPPVHAWACWRVYRLPWMDKPDREFLERTFQKLLLNFTWWVNRKDLDGNNLFGGGFLGLDNIGVFDRSRPLPTGGNLKQADGTAWMAFYCLMMLSMALELAQENVVYEDLASKFFEHFVRIVHASNHLGGCGLWDEEDGFYYDFLQVDGKHIPLRVRSIVGFIPLFAVTVVPHTYTKHAGGFMKRVNWFVKNRPLLASHLRMLNSEKKESSHYLLSFATKDRLVRLLRAMFDENEFLSPYGIRSVSRRHKDHPYAFHCNGDTYSVDYEPGEGSTGMFGGNSNWRGPIWFPINYLIVEALRVYHRFYGDDFLVEFPTGSGDWVTLGEASQRLMRRLITLFLPDAQGHRPCFGENRIFSEDPHFRDFILFNEYFHGENGKGYGASHQTGWTALVTDLLNLEKHPSSFDTWNF